ncbi:amino acid adenylation domain-containing protein [Plantactinospora sp. WMMC1484]|uniref:amino acid adenylation domain-containing protein n=1 Tax=Plantactinospora sp. WMMC1484 TaxID=3404122 RepID=UPI003BF5D76D
MVSGHSSAATASSPDEAAVAEFTLPAAWRRPDGDAAGDVRRSVPYHDLADRLRALGSEAGVELPEVLLAAHLGVLGTLTDETSFGTDIALPAAGRIRRASLDRTARDWRGRLRRMARGTGSPDAGGPGHRPDERAEGAADATAQAETEPGGRAVLFDPGGWWGRTAAVPPGRYGLRVTAGPGELLLHATGPAISPARLAGLALTYRSVLAAMATDPDGSTHATHLPPTDRRLVLEQASVGAPIRRGDATVVELIVAQAARTPEALAVTTAGGSLTYRELDLWSNQIAQHLVGLGAGPELLVGVCLRRTPELLPALLGVWKSGAGYLPLDADLPPERLRRMVDNARCRLILTTEPQLEALTGAADATLVRLDRDRATIASAPDAAPPVRVGAANLAYVMYTSGSTGDPKGVMVQHGGLANYLLWTADEYARHGTGGSPYFTSISFDLGMPSLFTPLLVGQRVHLLADPLDTADLGEQLVAGAPYAFVKLTPGHLNLLSVDLTPEQAGKLAGVVVAAGDAFPTELVSRWKALAGAAGTMVGTEYGPTEVTIGNSGQLVTDLPPTELIPLGTPVPNTTMYVLTDQLEPAPVGVPGEIYIGGSGVSRGYLGEPALTAARFVPDPYGGPGARLYQTGDRARWLSDGALEFLGRVDHQVKIRGYRVELGEIAAALHRHPTVGEAVVVTDRRPGRATRLAAFAVPAPGQLLDPRQIRRDLARELPDHMVPAQVRTVDRLPLTANGKLDVRALGQLLRGSRD